MPPLPDPLHPAIVHLPIALALLAPLFALWGILARPLGFPRGRSWAVVVVLQLFLYLTASYAERTGKAQEERVEAVVGESPVGRHEEAGERAVLLAGIAAGVALLGFLPGRSGWSARLLTLLAALGVLAAVTLAGSSGGDLVWRHGAASAYAKPPA
ncbi:MAG: DUF2231 domain-containing protein, partial [Candidatus Polarisedimenticolia bacterium]